MTRSGRRVGRRRNTVRQAGTPLVDTPQPEIAPLTLVALLERLLPSGLDHILPQRLSAFDETDVQVLQYVEDEEERSALIQLQIGPHLVRMMGFDMTARPYMVALAMDCAHWPSEDKQVMRAHKYHCILQYIAGSTDASEQLMLLDKLAACLLDDGLLGLVDPQAYNCMPAQVLRDLMRPEMRVSAMEYVPLILWAGFVKAFLEDNQVWYCSKAFHRWGVVDFAWLGTRDESKKVFDLFEALFHYVKDGDVKLKIGDTAQFGDDLILRFAAVTEYTEMFNGPLGTLVIERLDPDQFH